LSLIAGINLSDRVYLTSDTRVTRKCPSGLEYYRDNVLKTVRVSDDVVITAAGSVAAARACVIALRSAPEATDIRALRDRVTDLVRPVIDDYLREHTYEEARCVLMIAGRSPDRPKRVRFGRRFIQLFEAAKASEQKHAEMMVDILRDPRALALHQSALQQLGTKPPAIKAAVWAAMRRGADAEGFVTVPCADSRVFALSIGRDLIVDDADWGEMLIYGSRGVKRSLIPDETIGELEFAQADDLTPAVVLLTAMVVASTRELGVTTIGGGVVPFMISGNEISPFVAPVYRRNPDTGEMELISNVITDPDGELALQRSDGQRDVLIPFTDLDAAGLDTLEL
jgi:hypothetical protein